MTFSKLADDYVKHLGIRRGCSPVTCEGYAVTYSQFVTHLRARGLTDDIKHFTPESVEALITTLASRGQKASSVNTRLAHLSSIAKWAMTQKNGRGYLLDENPLVRIERLKKAKPKEKYLMRAELRALLTVETKPWERLALDMFIDTALRVSELANARVKDLRLEGDLLVLSVIVKGGRPRNVTLGRDLAERLEASLRQREAGPEAPLLINSRGDKFNRSSLTSLVFRLARRAGITRIKVRAHVLRHTYNAIGNAAGVGITERAGLLNHANTHTLQSYDHFFAGQLDAARTKVREAVAQVVSASAA